MSEIVEIVAFINTSVQSSDFTLQMLTEKTRKLKSPTFRTVYIYSSVNSVDRNKIKFDDILKSVGEFGPYQRRLYFLVSLPAITIAIQEYLPVFILDIPAYRCAIPGLENDTYTSQGAWHEKLLNESVPSDNGKWSECRVYSGNKTSEDINRTTTECHRWVYDTSTYINTAITQLNLVCGKESYRSHANMMYMAGSLLGCVVLGVMSDIVGRKKVMVMNIIIHVVAGLGLVFIADVAGLLVMRFLQGVSSFVLHTTIFGLGLELIGPSHRALCGIGLNFFWCFGMIAIGGLAYFVRDWNILALICSVPSVSFLSYGCLIPESPRWLVAKGRNSEAETIIRKMAESNERDPPFNMFDSNTVEEEAESNLKDILASPIIFAVSMILFYDWMIVSMYYYGVNLYVANLDGNLYLNFILLNCVEVFATAASIPLVDRLGRRVIMCASFIIGGSMAFCIPFLDTSGAHQWTMILMTMLGRLGCSSSFSVIYVYSAEVFPTVIRNSALGVASCSACIGGIIAPYIVDIGLLIGGDLQTALPLLVFGSISLLAGLLTLLLPETLHRQLPETIQDGIHLVKERMRLYGNPYTPLSCEMRLYGTPNTPRSCEKEEILLQ